MKERSTELVDGFRHSVPYINAHRGKTFVIMLGGEAIAHENFPSIINDIGLLHSLGIRLVVVYGARPQIDMALEEQKFLRSIINTHELLIVKPLKSLNNLPVPYNSILLLVYQ